MTPSAAFAALMADEIDAEEYLRRIKAEVEAERPATRYGRWVTFPDGFSRRLGVVEFLLIRAGVKQTVARGARQPNRRES